VVVAFAYAGAVFREATEAGSAEDAFLPGIRQLEGRVPPARPVALSYSTANVPLALAERPRAAPTLNTLERLRADRKARYPRPIGGSMPEPTAHTGAMRAGSRTSAISSATRPGLRPDGRATRLSNADARSSRARRAGGPLLIEQAKWWPSDVRRSRVAGRWSLADRGSAQHRDPRNHRLRRLRGSLQKDEAGRGGGRTRAMRRRPPP